MTTGQGTTGDGSTLSQAARGGQLPGTDDGDDTFQGTTETDRADTADDDAAASGANVDGDGDNAPAGALGVDLTTRDSDPQRADGTDRADPAGESRR